VNEWKSPKENKCREGKKEAEGKRLKVKKMSEAVNLSGCSLSQFSFIYNTSAAAEACVATERVQNFSVTLLQFYYFPN